MAVARRLLTSLMSASRFHQKDCGRLLCSIVIECTQTSTVPNGQQQDQESNPRVARLLNGKELFRRSCRSDIGCSSDGLLNPICREMSYSLLVRHKRL